MTAPPDAPKKPPRKRTQFGKRHNGQPKKTLAQQQRQVAAYMNMLKIASEK